MHHNVSPQRFWDGFPDFAPPPPNAPRIPILTPFVDVGALQRRLAEAERRLSLVERALRQ